jgi:hypothetical protein
VKTRLAALSDHRAAAERILPGFALIIWSEAQGMGGRWRLRAL